MDIPLAVDCPLCSEAGKKGVRLLQDASSGTEEVHCPNGHSYLSFEAATAEDTAQVPVAEAVVEPATEPHVAMSEVARWQEEIAPAPDAPALEPPPTSLVVPTRVEPSAVVPTVTALVRPTPGLPPLPSREDLATILADRARALRTLLPAPIRVPGGGLLIMLLIPDRHASFVLGEAETQRRPVQELMQERFEWALDQRWFF